MPELSLLAIAGIFIGGLVAIVLEIFVPGGIVGTLGGLTVLVSIIFAFGKGPAAGGIFLCAGVILVPAAALTAVKFAPRMPFSKELFLQESLGVDEGYVSTEEGLESLIGKEGVTVTMLRPSGIAEIGDRRTDVVADGEMIEKGARIEVVHVEGNRVVVREKGV